MCVVAVCLAMSPTESTHLLFLSFELVMAYGDKSEVSLAYA